MWSDDQKRVCREDPDGRHLVDRKGLGTPQHKDCTNVSNGSEALKNEETYRSRN